MRRLKLQVKPCETCDSDGVVGVARITTPVNNPRRLIMSTGKSSYRESDRIRSINRFNEAKSSSANATLEGSSYLR